ncbi:type II toxin-antitoxin system RelE/ParE family toxin [Sulfurimonas sp. SAG-AH-194-L11]|nr:type II toxin-antitoxin system RelE/ParE family toxin [Sulfurimonas sp. SAG-AH-194-L11]MDF1877542.1 type II toxin-antitoxin system RelE/ParE family toxin [Sulfurimonas sp. SAG-AH-194-L11]
MNIKYSDKSVKDLKNFTLPDRTLIVKKIHYLADNFELLKESKKVTQLKGCEFDNQYRFIVAKKIRVLFRILDNEIILLVLRVGQRKNIYK